MKIGENNENVFGKFYNTLPRFEKNKFLIYVCSKLSISPGTFYLRVKANSWKPVERDFVSNAIDTGEWKTL